MIITCFLLLLSLPVQDAEISAQETAWTAQDVADTVRIHESIELSQEFYDVFQNERSLIHAEHALDLSMRLFFAQEEKTDGHISDRIKALTIDSYVMYSRVMRDLDLQVAEDSLMAALKLVQETDISERAAIFSELGTTYERKGQNEKALAYSKSALELFQEAGDEHRYMDQLVNTGLVLRGMGSYGESLEYFVESLKSARQLNDSTAIAENLLAMGFVYVFAEKWEDALSTQREALEIYNANDNPWGIARIHNDMGVTYDRAGQIDSSLVHHRKALELRLESNDSYNTFSSYLYIGELLAEQGNITGAIEYYENGLTYSDEVGFEVMVVDAHLKLGDYYLEASRQEDAWQQYVISLQLSQNIGDPTGMSRANMALAQIAILRENYDEALVMLKTAEETMPESSLRMKEEMYKEISDTYFKLGDYENAYVNSIIYSEVKDSVLVAANLSKIEQLSSVMAFENEMALTQESNEKLMALKQLEINRERLTRNIFLGGMLVAVMLVGLVFVRFVEKKKLSDKLNDTLENLKATQSQLVQQEKLASLGQLTAGIAHEIKNPLNFVNNFSEVSIEMIDEARDEVNREIEDEEQKTGVLEILDEIEANLKTIHKHGSRADSIVKSMLEHSRGGSGKMEPTDLNALVKEYVNLAFHGMRAGKNPLNVDIDLQLDEKVGRVPLVGEDFSRVILNLVNNAFDACAERSRSACAEHSRSEKKTEDGGPKTGESYKPQLTVRTISDGKAVNIEIEDNGPGIPDEIKDNILQPFFTTKKGTAGTGLGLSITNDIVKAHGGIVDIKSQPGKTVFTIKLNG
jgi:signal transduction histidine kinase